MSSLLSSCGNSSYAGKPYAQLNVADHQAQVANGGVRPKIPTTWTDDLRTLIATSWARKQSARPSFEHIEAQLASWLVQEDTDALLRKKTATRGFRLCNNA